jgi:uncharacterized cupin superfamily protein
MPKAPLEDSGSGLAPAGDGWFVVNVRDAKWLTSENGEKQPSGAECTFESREFGFPQLGFRLHVLEPGEPNGLYHSESEQEAFLVLSGECRLLVEGGSGSSDRGTSSTALRGPSTSSSAPATGRA